MLLLVAKPTKREDQKSSSGHPAPGACTHGQDAHATLASSCTLAIKAIPGAPKNEVCGWLGDALKVKIHAPPVEGRANEALVEFFAEALDVPRRAVTLVRGDTSRHKTIRIDGLARPEVLRRLGVK